MSEIQFFVPGKPAAQGSKRALTRGGKTVMVEMSRDLAPWRQAIAEYAKAAHDGEDFTGPLRLQLVFYFTRPASHYGTGKKAGILKDSAPTWRASVPDLDKLVRAVGDGLTASGVIADDRFIAKVYAEKRYGDPGVLVNLQQL